MLPSNVRVEEGGIFESSWSRTSVSHRRFGPSITRPTLSKSKVRRCSIREAGRKYQGIISLCCQQQRYGSEAYNPTIESSSLLYLSALIRVRSSNFFPTFLHS